MTSWIIAECHGSVYSSMLMASDNQQSGPMRFIQTEETDEDLLLYMSMQDELEYQETARVAWDAFYRRHRKFLLYACRKAGYGVVLGENGLEDLVHDTLVRAYERADQFRSEGSGDAAVIRRRVRAWLSGIAANLFRSWLREHPIAFIHLDESEWKNRPGASISCEPTSRHHALLIEAFETLSERENLVVLRSAEYYKPGAKYQRLPNAVSEELATMFETTSDNIRQIRSRAIRKIKEYVLEHLDV